MAKDINSSPKRSRDKELVLCHESKIDFLSKIISGGKIPHAFLFSGPCGIGKATVAYQFAKMVLSVGVSQKNVVEEVAQEIDLFGAPATPTHNNSVCEIDKAVDEKVRSRTHLDMLVLEMTEESEGKNIGVDEIRNIGKFLSLTPAEGKYRVAIIDSIDDFNSNSSNAILKILEEPTHNTVLIIICHNKINLLPTIKSRCLEIKFTALSKKDFILVMSDLGYENESLEDIYNLSEGSPGLALEMIEKNALETVSKYQKIIKQKTINISEVISIAKEIKEKDSWKIFSNLFLKNYSNEIRTKKDITEKDFNKFNELNKIISFSEYRNMDIQDTLKKLTYQIRSI